MQPLNKNAYMVALWYKNVNHFLLKAGKRKKDAAKDGWSYLIGKVILDKKKIIKKNVQVF